MRSSLRSWTWLATFAVVVLTAIGCSTGIASVHVKQIAPAGLTPQDVVGVVVVTVTESVERQYAQKVTKCINRALDDSRVETRTVEVPRISMMIRNGSSWRSLGFAEDTLWQALAADVDFQKNVNALGLRYLIAVSISESIGPPTSKTEFAVGFGGFGFDLTSNRQMLADVQAIVIDPKNARLAARVDAEGRANSQSGVMLLFGVIPIPHWSSSSPFDPACRKLGIGVSSALRSSL